MRWRNHRLQYDIRTNSELRQVSLPPTAFKRKNHTRILCYFCAVLCRIRRILCHAPHGRFWHMPCVHRGILADLGVPNEFSRVWSTANFVLLLCYFVPYTPNFAPCSLWEILTLCHVCTVAFLWVSVSQGIFRGLAYSEWYMPFAV